MRFFTCRTPSLPSSEPQIAADYSLLPGLLLGLISSSFPLEVLTEVQECLPRKIHTLAQQHKKRIIWKLREDHRSEDNNSKREKKKMLQGTTSGRRSWSKSSHAMLMVEIMKIALSLCDLPSKIFQLQSGCERTIIQITNAGRSTKCQYLISKVQTFSCRYLKSAVRVNLKCFPWKQTKKRRKKVR